MSVIVTRRWSVWLADEAGCAYIAESSGGKFGCKVVSCQVLCNCVLKVPFAAACLVLVLAFLAPHLAQCRKGYNGCPDQDLERMCKIYWLSDSDATESA